MYTPPPTHNHVCFFCPTCGFVPIFTLPYIIICTILHPDLIIRDLPTPRPLCRLSSLSHPSYSILATTPCYLYTIGPSHTWSYFYQPRPGDYLHKCRKTSLSACALYEIRLSFSLVPTLYLNIYCYGLGDLVELLNY